MDRFIAQENVRLFRDRLGNELNPAVRARLRDLLIAEEDKFGASQEFLADIDRHISDCNRRISRQQVIVATMARDGHNGHAQAQRLLNCLLDSLDLHQLYRQRISLKDEQEQQ
jgi:hypothetical protein